MFCRKQTGCCGLDEMIPPDTNFWAWACRVAHYQALAHLKRQRRDSRCLSLDLIEQLAEEISAPPQFSERLLSALVYCRDKLGKASRNLVDLRYGEMLLAPQIAERTGRSPVAVRQASLRHSQGSHALHRGDT